MQRSQKILLVEDDFVDVMTIKRALKDIGVDNEVVHFTNGEEAFAYLSSKEEKPCIIIMDLNTPRMSGIEFLKIVKSNRELKMIPAVVLTTSNNEKDIAESFEYNADGYMVKPADYEEFVETMRTIRDYWMLSKLSNRR